MAGKDLMARGEKRRKDIYRFLVRYQKANGWAPTVQEIADNVGLVSPNATRTHLLKLQQQGLIKMEPRGARCIQILPQPVTKVTGDTTVREIKQFLKQHPDQAPDVAALCGLAAA